MPDYNVDPAIYEDHAEQLGEGFGTGEYTLRGRFRADLRTGRIVDLEAPA